MKAWLLQKNDGDAWIFVGVFMWLSQAKARAEEFAPVGSKWIDHDLPMTDCDLFHEGDVKYWIKPITIEG